MKMSPSQPKGERLRQFLALVPNANWSGRGHPPAVWNDQVREALADRLITVRFGGLLKLTDAGRAALQQGTTR